MRLLLRSPAAGLDPFDPDAEVEIAASPDTHARRPWEWDVRLTHRPEGLSRTFEGAGLGRHHVDVRVRPDVIDADLRTVLQEDADALALQEIGLRTRPPGEFDVLIAQDAGVAKARKVMQRLLAAESTSSAQLEPATS